MAEVLQDLRPATKDRAAFQSLFGTEPPTGTVSYQWRLDRRMGRARLEVDPALIVDLEDLAVCTAPATRVSRTARTSTTTNASRSSSIA